MVALPELTSWWADFGGKGTTVLPELTRSLEEESGCVKMNWNLHKMALSRKSIFVASTSIQVTIVLIWIPSSFFTLVVVLLLEVNESSVTTQTQKTHKFPPYFTRKVEPLSSCLQHLSS